MYILKDGNNNSTYLESGSLLYIALPNWRVNYKVKTQIGFLKIAKKYNLKLIPIQTIREKINNFRIIFHPPLNSFKNYRNDIDAMSRIHKLIEEWIKKNPDQWLWQHKRFD